MWIGPFSWLFTDKISGFVMRCFNSVKFRTIFTTPLAFSSTPKDVLPILPQTVMGHGFQ